jgi:FMN phosphatase YigB (HAD superfamily)
MERVGVRDPSKVMHFGQDFDRDVVGAAKAGLQPFWVAVPAQDRLEPEQEALKVRHVTSHTDALPSQGQSMPPAPPEPWARLMPLWVRLSV